MYNLPRYNTKVDIGRDTNLDLEPKDSTLTPAESGHLGTHHAYLVAVSY